MKKSELIQIIKEELGRGITSLGDLKLGVNIEVGDHLPEPFSDEMVKIYSQEALDNYLKGKDLNTQVIIDKNEPWFNQYRVPAFEKGRQRGTQAKQSFLDRERSVGRTGGLDENEDRGDYLETMELWKKAKRANMKPEDLQRFKDRLHKAAEKLGIQLSLD